jgi:hypothetical protein
MIQPRRAERDEEELIEDEDSIVDEFEDRNT